MLRIQPAFLVVSAAVFLSSTLLPSSLPAQLVLVEEGGDFAPDNLASADAGALPFASDQLVGFENIHNILHLNDGFYGNSQSWIGESALPAFVGVALDGAETVASIAFGRDNGGEEQEFMDRSLGLYRVQVTTVASPDETTPEEDWQTVGEVEYDGTCPARSWLRHRFDFAPVQGVTGVRVIVPLTGLGGGTAIDEIEVYGEASGAEDLCAAFVPLTMVEEGGTFAASNLATGASASAFASSEIGSDFCFLDTFEFLEPVEEGGTFDDNNIATDAGATAFAIDSLEGFPIHDLSHLNDGLYGNENSWIGNSGFPAFAGISFDRLVTVRSFAFGRDNGGEANQFTDRSVGLYTLQFTDVEAPDSFTPDEDWITIAEFSYDAGCPERPYLRHRFNFADEIELTGLRLLVPGSGIGGGTCIDEIEIYGEAGTPGGPVHPIANLNDGEYGDTNAWYAGEGDPAFAGVALGGSFDIASVAFGRDNGGEETAFTDRTEGVYTIQVTTAADPDESTPDGAWTTLGFVQLSAAKTCPQRPSARHRFAFSPVQATGVRILVPEGGAIGGTAIDEIEVYAAPGGDTDICADARDPCSDPEQTLTLAESGGSFDETNLALLPGVTPFVIDSLAGFDIHDFSHLNDGIYGNTNSWIGNSGNPAFAGLDLGGTKTIGSIAWGRDNGGEPNEFTDRSLGRYCIEYTNVADPDASTPHEAWRTVAVVEYTANEPPLPHLRHRWDFEEPIQATAIRIIVPGAGIGGGTCIDEIELYESACGDDCGGGSLCPEDGEPLELVEIGGPFTTPALPFDVPSFDDGNLALGPGAIAFGTEAHEAPAHAIEHLNDGFYGNDNSWLGVAPGETTNEVYAGIYFEDGPEILGGIALGRDNGGTFNDRVFGCYAVQVTEDDLAALDDASIAAASWQTVGLASSHRSDGEPLGLRRSYALPNVRARAVRIVLPIQSAIDEIELYEGEEVTAKQFIRGDSDASGTINLTDGVYILGFLFLGGPDAPCAEAADADNSGTINLTDGIFVLNWLFLGGDDPPPPGPTTCGTDPDPAGSPGDLGCAAYDACP